MSCWLLCIDTDELPHLWQQRLRKGSISLLDKVHKQVLERSESLTPTTYDEDVDDGTKVQGGTFPVQHFTLECHEMYLIFGLST